MKNVGTSITGRLHFVHVSLTTVNVQRHREGGKNGLGELVRISGSTCREQGHKQAGASEEMVLGAW